MQEKSQNPKAAQGTTASLTGPEFIVAIARLAKDFEEFTANPPKENYGNVAYKLEERLKNFARAPYREEDQHLELLARKAADFVISPLPSRGFDFEELKARDRILRTVFSICSRRGVAASDLLAEIELSGKAFFNEDDPGQAKLGYLILSVERDNTGAGQFATFKKLLAEALPAETQSGQS